MSGRAVPLRALRAEETLHFEDSIEHARRRLLATDLPSLPVLDRDGRLTGFFGEREAVHTLRRHDDHVGDHVRAAALGLGPDATDAEVADTFAQGRAALIPILDGTRLVGIITRRDAIRALAQHRPARPSVSMLERLQVLVGVLTFVIAILIVVVAAT